ncbi:MAG: adenylate/guanylate cyclase domain-containing protein [Flavobacteriales bacterium]
MRSAFLILSLLCFQLLAGQSDDIKFSRFTTKAGLSHNIVNEVIQDGRGFMWFGTQDGLNRYDGYNFVVYKPDLYNSTSLSNNRITALCYDPRGFIWVGTAAGLNIYKIDSDQFISLSNLAGNSLAASKLAIQSIYRDQLGSIWVATREGGISKITLMGSDLESIQVKHFVYQQRDPNTISSNNVTAITQDASGIIWVGTDNGLNIYSQQTQNFKRILHDKGKGESLSNNYITSISEDINGDVWVGTRHGLNRVMINENDMKNLGFKVHPYFFNPGNPYSLSDNRIQNVFQDKEGILWVGTDHGLNAIDLTAKNPKDTTFQFVKYFSEAIKELSLAHNKVNKIFQDESGIIWLATERGVSKFDKLKQKLQNYSMEQYWDITTHTINVWSLCEDDAGGSWVGNEKGVCYINRKKGITRKVAYKEQMNVYALCYDKKKRVLAGTDQGLFIVEKNSDTSYVLKRYNLPGIKDFIDPVYSILCDSRGTYWIGGQRGLVVMNNAETKAFKHYYDVNNFKGIGKGAINFIFEDASHAIWLATNGGGLNKVLNPHDLNLLEFLKITHDKKIPSSLNNDVILCIEEYPKGTLWLGTYGGGLNKYDIERGRTKHFTEQNGLSNNILYGILRDNSGKLWLSTNKGLSKFDPVAEKFRVFKEEDGLQSDEFNKGAFYKSKRGELYFGGINGFNVFFPEDVKPNKVPPKIALTALLLSNKLIEPGPNSLLKKDINSLEYIEIPYVDNAITIRYSGLHFTSPENNQYSYILEGFMENWQDVGNKREVSFTNLDPGIYTFRVRAANSDGIKSNDVPSLKIIITPPFWMTWWFRTFIIAIVLAIVLGVYYSRVAIIKTQKRVLEYKVQQRTEEVMQKKGEIEEQKEKLEIEKNKTEQLLLNILPAETAKELLSTGRAAPRHYRMVTVMFADFKGFTQIAERLRPAELVEELDTAFNAFDDIADKHNIEKIKTSGDAYMAAGGVPIRNKTNPVDCILAAMQIQAYIKDQVQQNINNPDKPKWELRVGIHTGEIIAGVVGKKKFAYDIWGNTVNTASRMESSSQPGQINISGTTYNMVQEYFDCEYRGKIPVKNKGDIDMYFVKGIKPELSKDRKGLVPNIAFQELHHFNVYSKLNYNKVKQYVINKLEKELPENLYYHGPHHTRDVVQAAERIGKAEGLDPEELMLVKMAALLHDAGFLNKYWSNEPEGVKIAKEMLPAYGFTDSQIDIIEGLIMATSIPQKPTNHLEEIICDADLDYLGRDDFEKISLTLQQELLDYGGIKNPEDWDPIQVKFLTAHKYFTKTNIETRQAKKQEHLENIKRRIEANSK